MIHGYVLHFVYDCSVHLLGAIWSSLTPCQQSETCQRKQK